jgi:hypothetical protein
MAIAQVIAMSREQLQELVNGSEAFPGSGDVGDAIVSLEQAERRVREAAEQQAAQNDGEVAPDAAADDDAQD